MQHLGIIEQRTNEVLQMYAASGAAFQQAGGMSSNENSETMESSSTASSKEGRRLSLGVGPQQPSGSHIVRVEPPDMEELDDNSAAFMMDESDRPMTRVELLRIIKDKPATIVSSMQGEKSVSGGGGTGGGGTGGRRKRR